MYFKGLSKMISTELSFIIPRTLILDGIIYIATLPIYKFSWEIPLGLVLGSAVMLLNFIILGLFSERAVERPVGSAKRFMMLSYFIRMAIMGVFFYMALKLPYFNIMATVIPQFYPKLFYTLDAMTKKKKGGKGL